MKFYLVKKKERCTHNADIEYLHETECEASISLAVNLYISGMIVQISQIGFLLNSMRLGICLIHLIFKGCIVQAFCFALLNANNSVDAMPIARLTQNIPWCVMCTWERVFYFLTRYFG